MAKLTVETLTSLFKNGPLSKEAILETLYETENAVPMKSTWTLLDRAPGGSVCLVGTPDGRIGLVMSIQGPWKADDFRSPAPTPDNWRWGKATVYRHSYDGARQVYVSYAHRSKEWYAKEGQECDTSGIGHVTPALDEELYEDRMRAFATSLVETFEPGSDREEWVARTTSLLLMVARHSFNRAWHERGYGFLG